MVRVKEKALTLEEKLEQALVPVEEQPYEVPENWCWVHVDGLYIINPKVVAADDTEAAFIPMERIEAGINSAFTFERQTWSKARKGHTQFADGDIAFAKISPCFENRKSMIIEGLPNGIGGGTTELIVLRNPMVNQRFTYYQICSDSFIQGGRQTYSGTVGQQRISMDYVRSYPIPLPPLPEQHRIVEQIDRLFSELDEAKEKAQAVIDGYEDRCASILHRAFTGELTEEWRQDQRISFDSWIVKPLCDLCDRIFDGPFGSNLKSDDYVEKGIRVVRLENLKNLWFDDSKKSFVTEEKYSSISGHTVYPTDLIMATFIADEIKICQMPEYIGYAVNKADCIGIRVSNGTDKRFVLYYLSSKQTFNHLFNQLHGATRPRVNTKQIKAIPVPLPTLAEQAEIVRILDSLLSKESAAKSLAERAIAQIDATKQSILARAFRGELGTNDPEDEPAIDLLKRTLEGT